MAKNSNRGKKKYSVEQRKLYHEKRVNSPKVSENKQLYSREWLDGFTDSHPKENYDGVKDEIAARKRNKAPHSSYDIILHGYKNGLAARLNKK